MYNRLFTKILDSSIWLEDVTTRIVWITLLAAMDEDGYAHFSAVENLALRARVSVSDAQFALARLMAPDPNSENPSNEGRRIERVAGGFFVINAADHRKAMNREIRREQTRLRVQRHRDKACNANSVTLALQPVTSASASASDKKKSTEKKSTTETDWLNELKADPAFKGLNVQREFDKASRWCKENNRQLTRRRFVNWLNRADQRIDSPKQSAPLYPKLPPKREPTDQELEQARLVAREETQRLKAQLQ